MNASPYIALSLLGGAVVPLQLVIVNALRQHGEASQIQAVFWLYVGGMLASGLCALLLQGTVWPAAAPRTGWWMWTSGFLGMFYMLFMFIATPHIGAANTLVWVFLGQILFAVILDAAGLTGAAAQQLNPAKWGGILLIGAGGLLMLYGNR